MHCWHDVIQCSYYYRDFVLKNTPSVTESGREETGARSGKRGVGERLRSQEEVQRVCNASKRNTFV